MWKRHWKLSRDPFLDPGAPFVPTPTHQEAVARLVETIERGQRSAILRAAPGSGKSRVLSQALAETRSPSRRVARLSSPVDGAALASGLAEALGARVEAGAGRAVAWKALTDAVRVCRWQRLQVVLAIDDCQDLRGLADRHDLERLTHVDPDPEARLTIVQVFRDEDDPALVPDSWDLAIRLDRLTRSESEQYLVVKLDAAGRAEPTFTPRAVDRLHAGSEGLPRGLDRLASLALMAGAVRGLEIITPEVIDGVALECTSGTWSR